MCLKIALLDVVSGLLSKIVFQTILDPLEFWRVDDLFGLILQVWRDDAIYVLLIFDCLRQHLLIIAYFA